MPKHSPDVGKRSGWGGRDGQILLPLFCGWELISDHRAGFADRIPSPSQGQPRGTAHGRSRLLSGDFGCTHSLWWLPLDAHNYLSPEQVMPVKFAKRRQGPTEQPLPKRDRSLSLNSGSLWLSVVARESFTDVV